MKRYSKLRAQCWMCYLPGKHPNAEITVLDSGEIKVGIYPGGIKEGYAMIFPRRFARLLARRINQALEAE